LRRPLGSVALLGPQPGTQPAREPGAITQYEEREEDRQEQAGDDLGRDRGAVDDPTLRGEQQLAEAIRGPGAEAVDGLA
jgi:hypothetical protein